MLEGNFLGEKYFLGGEKGEILGGFFWGGNVMFWGPKNFRMRLNATPEVIQKDFEMSSA